MKKAWPSSRLQDLLGIDLPIVQAPMAGADSPELALAVAEAGGLGSLACTLLSVDELHATYVKLTQSTSRPLNLNFFCHKSPTPDAAREAAWRQRLKPFYDELSIDPATIKAGAARAPFNDDFCSLLEELSPRVVSFHFGLPSPAQMTRLKVAGIVTMASATSLKEALWLEDRGCDVIIAQGAEAGGHRSMFLETHPAYQTGTLSLLAQVSAAVKVPVIATGGIADGRTAAAAFKLGADGIQLGTAYLFCPEARISPLYRQALSEPHETAITNVFSGRPARGIANRFVREVGPLSALAPAFPTASPAVAPLRAKSEARGSTDFMQMWAGQSAHLGREMPAVEFTRELAEETLALL